MNENDGSVRPGSQPAAGERHKRGKRWIWIFGSFLVVVAAVLIGLHHLVAIANPILRARVIETLSARFNTKVELADLDVSVSDGLNVSGKGLKIFGSSDPDPSAPGIQPLIAVAEFRFRTGLLGLLRSPMHVDTVHVTGMSLNIPPRDSPQVGEVSDEQTAEARGAKGKPSGGKNSVSRVHRLLPSHWLLNRWNEQKISIEVDHFVCDDTKVIINTDRPGKAPLEFRVRHLVMNKIGPGQPLRFDATLINPKPEGDIQSSGSLGPFQQEHPGDTPVAGEYSFTHADLGTLKGIKGILSSTGNYHGTLARIEVQGSTDTPDFRLSTGHHPVDLRTTFHAVVDGMDGDTYLDPVDAHFLNSSVTATGKVVRIQNPSGHDIELKIGIDHARIEDLLELGVKTNPPVLSGNIQVAAQMKLPPGKPGVMDRLQLDGTFHIPDAEFSNGAVQGRIDSFSLRSQGKAKLAEEHVNVPVTSDLSGSFRLKDGLISFSRLNFEVPGTHADMTGQYSLDGKTFDFHGKVKLDAKLSQMTTGWKSLLLKAVDPFFHKGGAGAEIPFKITGTKSAPHFGLDLKASQREANPTPIPEQNQTSRSAKGSN